MGVASGRFNRKRFEANVIEKTPWSGPVDLGFAKWECRVLPLLDLPERRVASYRITYSDPEDERNRFTVTIKGRHQLAESELAGLAASPDERWIVDATQFIWHLLPHRGAKGLRISAKGESATRAVELPAPLGALSNDAILDLLNDAGADQL